MEHVSPAVNLVTMANDIANFFHGAADPGAAPRSVADHIRRYWHPRMRKQMLAHYAEGGQGLNDIARAAVGMLAGAASVSTAPPPAPNAGPPMEG
jgi:formate dehydrogenase subunit delta